MSSAFSLPDEGDEIDGPGLSKPIRLSEVPQIAERFEGGVDGSLKEAFALRSADALEAPEPAIIDRAVAEPLPSEADAVAVVLASLPIQRPDVASAEPPPIGAPQGDRAMEPPHPADIAETTPAAQRLAESPEASEPTAGAAPDLGAQPPTEIAPAAAGDHIETPPPATPPLAAEAIETPGPPAEEAIETERPLTGALPDADAASSASPPVSPPLFQPEQATRPFAGTHSSIFPLEFASDVAANRLERSWFDEDLATQRTPDRSEPAATERPLASALDTAAKLAADANAAAEALENLKRLLDRQLPNPAQGSQQPIHEIFAEARASHEPPPLPAHEPLPEEPASEEAPSSEPKPFPRPGARNTPWRERRQFDLRGFMAGFALSWAIGAALYIYLTAG